MADSADSDGGRRRPKILATYKYLSFASLKSKGENKLLKRFERLLDGYTNLVFTCPFVFLLLGLGLSGLQLSGLAHFDSERLQTNVVDLITPLDGQVKADRDRLNEIFGNLPEGYFRPYQVIKPGYSFVVLTRTRDDRNLLNNTILNAIADLHMHIKKNISVKPLNSKTDNHTTFETVCATYNKTCVVKGESALRLLQESLQIGEGNVTCPVYNGIDLSEILGNIVCANGTLASASIYKLTYFVSGHLLPSSIGYSWIRKFVEKIERTNTPAGLMITPTHTHLTSSDIDVDVTDFDLQIIYGISHGGLALPFLFGYRICGLLVLGMVSLGTLGIISYIQIPFVKLMIFAAAMIFDWSFHSCVYMLGDFDKKELKEYGRYNITKLIYVLFFSVGLFSSYLIIRALSAAVCISVIVCVLFGATVIPAYHVIQHKYINVICNLHCSKLKCVLRVFGCTESESKKEEERQEEQTQENQSDNVLCRFLSRVKIIICVVLYVAYFGGSIYGFIVDTRVPTLCDRSPADYDTYSHFCKLNLKNYKPDVIVTIAVESINISNFEEFTDTYRGMKSILTKLKSRDEINDLFEINLMSSFLHLNSTESNFGDRVKTFLDENPEYTKDIVVDSNGTPFLNSFRVYLKISDTIDSEVLYEVREKLQEIINNSTIGTKMKIVCYAPEFLLHEKIAMNGIYVIFAVSAGILFILVCVARYHYKFKLLLIVLVITSVLFGVVGFSRIWNVGLTYLSTVPVLFIFASIAELSLSNTPLYIWFVYSFGVVIFVLIFTFPLFTLRSIYIPLFLYFIISFLHFLLANVIIEQFEDTFQNTAQIESEHIDSDNSNCRNTQDIQNGESSTRNEQVMSDLPDLEELELTEDQLQTTREPKVFRIRDAKMPKRDEEERLLDNFEEDAPEDEDELIQEAECLREPLLSHT